ncbi:MAG TPA: peptidylprolyl isomerase [Blastocatellia bacterium]|nr:peptidylprolyl isomerase [Blastocatellia bacterium]
MKLSAKAIGVILVVVAAAGAMLMSQRWSSSPTPAKLTAHDMEVLVNEVFPPAQQTQLASDPEKKKQFAKGLKDLLALAYVAESEGYLDKPDVQAQVSLQADIALRDAYQKKNPESKATEEEINEYHKSHASDYTAFTESSPQVKQEAEGPRGESLKRQFGEIKVIAERARKEGVGGDDATKLRVLIERSNILARAYVTDLRKDSKFVTDADIEEYYQAHQGEFEEVRARHILIRVGPEEGDEEGEQPQTKKAADKGPKALTEDQARKKATSLLDRIRKGEDFAKLAGEFSDDPGSKVKGGLLEVGGNEFFAKGTMVPEFENAAFSLKPGEISDVVESQFGFHIIKVEERRTAPVSDAATRQKINNTVAQNKLEKRIEEIAATTKVEVAEDFNVTTSAPPQPASLPGPPGQ